MRSLTIIIPGVIPKELNPNWQPRGEGLRYIKASAIGSLKELAYLYAVHCRNTWERETGEGWVALERAEIKITIAITFRMKRWDSTNIRAALKYAEDGLVRAAIIQDDSPDHVSWEDVEWEEGAEPEIRIEVKGE